jgi:ADP-ribose pyrophosphatase
LSRDPVLLSEGRHLHFVHRDGWEYVDRPGITGIVLLVPITNDGAIVLVEQLRPPVGGQVIELPAGLSGDEEGGRDEPLEESARRELLEETGYEAATMERLVEGPPSPGVSSEIVTYFLARGLVKRNGGGGVGGERIIVHDVPLDRAHEWLLEQSRKGLLIDAKVWAGLYFAGRFAGPTDSIKPLA